MKPVFQTIVHPEHGNCWAACLASILECPLECIPNFMADGESYFRLREQEWLRSQGLYVVRVFHPWDGCSKGLSCDIRSLMDMPFIASVPSQKFEGVSHAVIATLLRKDTGALALTILHDPNAGNEPYDTATLKPRQFTFVVNQTPTLREPCVP